jgi:hypothetical protein
MPGISGGQCPSSYNGYMVSDQSSTLCGFRTIEAAINLEGVQSVELFGRMEVIFSNNVEILGTPIALKNYVNDIEVNTNNKYELNFNIGEVCENVEINDDDRLIRIEYIVKSGTTATVRTNFTRLAYCITAPTATICPNYSEAADITINVDQYELKGNILIPGQFSCSGGSSTDHGLPDREVTITMLNSPGWIVCGDIETDNYGFYNCDIVKEDCDYEICVVGPEDDYCSLDEFDLDIIRDHILGYDCFDYKWQYYAGDATHDGTVSSGDIFAITTYLLYDNDQYLGIPWKYVSNTQYDNYTPYSSSGCPISVPTVSNCLDITVNNDPTHEDWYGIPTGDVNHSCTTCGFWSPPDIHVRSNNSKIPIIVRQVDEKSFILSINHTTGIAVWTIALNLDFPVDLIDNISLNNGNYLNELLWHIDKQNNIVKIAFVEIKGQDVYTFDIQFVLSKSISINTNSWSFNRELTKLNNVLIDAQKNIYFWEDIITKTFNDLYIYPNPANNTINLSQINIKANEVFLYYLDGRQISRNKLNSKSIDISNLQQGTYILRYKDPNFDRKFIIAKF